MKKYLKFYFIMKQRFIQESGNNKPHSILALY